MTSDILTDPVFYDINLPPSVQRSRGISYYISRFQRCTVLGPGGAGGNARCIDYRYIYPGGGGGGGGGSSIIIYFNTVMIGSLLSIFPGVGGSQDVNDGDGGVTAIILNNSYTLIVPGGKGGKINTVDSGGNGGNGADLPYLILDDDPNNIVPYNYGQNLFKIIQYPRCYGGGAGVNVLDTKSNFISGNPGIGYPNPDYNGTKATLIYTNKIYYYLAGAGGGSMSPWGGNFVFNSNYTTYASGGSGGSYGTDPLPIIIGELRFNPIPSIVNNTPISGSGANNERNYKNSGIPGVSSGRNRITQISPKIGSPGGGGGGAAVKFNIGTNDICTSAYGANGGNGKIIFEL